MHGRKIFLLASIILPIIAAPLSTNEVSIGRNDALTVGDRPLEVLKREPIIETIPTEASYDVAVDIKREESSTKDDEVGEDAVDVVDDSSDDMFDRRGLRGNGGAGGHKRGLRGNGGAGGHKRGLRGNGGAGGHKRGLRGNGGAGGHKRGLRGNGGAGGHKRSLFSQVFGSIMR